MYVHVYVCMHVFMQQQQIEPSLLRASIAFKSHFRGWLGCLFFFLIFFFYLLISKIVLPRLSMNWLNFKKLRYVECTENSNIWCSYTCNLRPAFNIIERGILWLPSSLFKSVFATDGQVNKIKYEPNPGINS